MQTVTSRRRPSELEWEFVEPDPNPVPDTGPLVDPAPGTTTSPARRTAVAALVVLAVVGPFAGLVIGRASVGSGVDGPPVAVGDPASVPSAASAPLVPPGAIDPAVDGLALRLTSEDGRFQAWSEPLAEGETIYAPGGRSETTLVVRDSLDGSTETFTYRRNLEPEAFSPDGSTLYVIDHRPATDPEVYRVTAADLRTGALREVIGPLKTPLTEEMRGEGRQQVWAPDGTQLYTLYVRQTHVHVDGTEPHIAVAGEDAFVHVLDVRHEWALCLELPPGFGMGPDGSTDIMVSNDGDTITVVDHHIGQRVDIHRLPAQGGMFAEFEVGSPTLIGR